MGTEINPEKKKVWLLWIHSIISKYLSIPLDCARPRLTVGDRVPYPWRSSQIIWGKTYLGKVHSSSQGLSDSKEKHPEQAGFGRHRVSLVLCTAGTHLLTQPPSLLLPARIPTIWTPSILTWMTGAPTTPHWCPCLQSFSPHGYYKWTFWLQHLSSPLDKVPNSALPSLNSAPALTRSRALSHTILLGDPCPPS